MATDVELPPGFVLDELPEGFELDQQPQGFQLPTMEQLMAGSGQVDVAGPNRGAADPRVLRAMGDVAATMGSAAIAEPVAGASGALGTLLAGPELGAETVRQLRDRLTVPLGAAGQQGLGQAVEGIPAPIRRTLSSASERFTEFADVAAEAFGPGAGAFVRTLPTAAAELAGLKGGRKLLQAAGKADRLTRGQLMVQLKDVAPTVDQLREQSRILYRELDDAGAAVANPPFRNLASTMAKSARSKGARRAGPILREIQDMAANQPDIALEDIVSLRQSLANAARSPDPQIAAPGAAMLDDMDAFLDSLTKAQFSRGGVQGAGAKLRLARELHRRAKRSEALTDAVKDARVGASDFEQAIRTEFRKLTKGKNKRYFTEAELDEIRSIVQGTGGANLFRKLGKLGIGDLSGAGTNTVGAGVGAALGFAGAGTAGLIAVPLIGTVSRKLAERLTRRNGEFANAIVRAGNNPDRIIQAYRRFTPRARQSQQELAQLLINPDIPLQTVAGNPITQQAAITAMQARQRIAELAAAAATGAQANQE